MEEIQRNAQDVTQWYPELRGVDRTTSAVLAALDLFRWVKAKEVDRECVGEVPTNAQEAAGAAYSTLVKLWSRKGKGLMEECIAKAKWWAKEVPRTGNTRLEVPVSEDVLDGALKKSKGKTHGADQWAPGHWADLGPSFFVAAAAFWNEVLDGMEMPEAWAHARVVRIPKDDGGDRYLSVAAAMCAKE